MCWPKDRVFIITGLRIQALRMVNAEDFTYSKGYLGLLSTLGALLGIIFCCVPYLRGVYTEMREMLRKRSLQPDEEVGATSQETPNVVSRPRIDDGDIQAHSRSGRLSLDRCGINGEPPPYGGLKKHRTFWITECRLGGSRREDEFQLEDSEINGPLTNYRTRSMKI